MSAEREEFGICESCDCKLFEGDRGFVYSDGPMFCAACSPTWVDLDETDAYDDPADYAEFVARKEAHVANGGSVDDQITVAL